MTILLRMDDKMNRQLTCQVTRDESASLLSHELVHLGFIHEVSATKIRCFESLLLLNDFFSFLLIDRSRENCYTHRRHTAK